MKLLSQQLNLNLSITFQLCSLIVVISCMSAGFNCLIFADGNRLNDRLALIAFKNEIIEDPLGTLSSWNNNNDSLHFCKWKGVTCSGRHRTRVTVLDLNSQGLVGSISPHIGNLSFLTDLILSSNSLTREIPQQIGRLFRLKHFNLSYNNLEGEIPSNISRCSNLIHLDISHNNLVGIIPNEFAHLSYLKVMWLQYNNLSGEVPTSLGNFSTSLTQLGLGYNNFHGSIPDTLSQLTRLKFLDISSNKLSGVVPSSLYNMSSLEVFSLMFNQLHGVIPLDIGFTLPKLIIFTVSGNNFTGNIPASFSNSSSLKTLQLYRNNFVGSVPYNLGDSNSLIRLNLGENNLGSGQANDLDFLNSLINCTSLKFIFCGVNNFGGVLPISLSNLSTNIDTVHFAENQIYGSIPEGIQNLVSLTTLVLAGNLFSGRIPLGIGNLQNLGVLDLRRNKLSGSLPSSLGNLTRLIELTLSFNGLTGSIPPSIGNCKSLQSLVLSSNRLTGTMPKQVFELPSLSRFLNLGNNSLTGLLPTEVGNLKNLGILDLSENKLSGQIPSTIGECSSLTGLFLDGNYFQGNIPPAITFLKGLETLSVSRNNLSGIIPQGLENLTLGELNLSYNNLEGMVPRYGVFMNISAFSVDGNSKLCGGIPDLKLSNCNVLVNKRHVKNIRIIIITIVVVFLISVMFFLTLYWMKKSKTKPPTTALDVATRYKGVSYNELLKATNGFNESTNLLGTGSFGSVYKGILQDESKPVAVKVIHLQQRGATKSFMAECDALRRLRHRNLLKIVTCCSSTDFQSNPFKALVFEFMANGNLENWLHPIASSIDSDDQLQQRNLTLERRLNIADDIASALNYLHHECQSPVIHCDLKPSNVLLDDDLIAHVGDFGLSKFLSYPSSYSGQLNEQDASSIGIKGSIGYVSPEYGIGGTVSTQGDVYSYGILLLEMFTVSNPDFVRMQLNLTKQRNNPNLLLSEYEYKRNPGRFCLSKICFIRHDLLESLSSTGNFLDYAVRLDHPLKYYDSAKIKGNRSRKKTKIMGCCDGLVCLWFGSFFCLWNPATREYKELPKPNLGHGHVDMVAFGYDYKNHDYKLLAGGTSLFQIFSLRLNLWKSIENVPYHSFGFYHKESGVFFNGDQHWIAKRQHSPVVLVSLDISSEIFKEMELPEKVLLDLAKYEEEFDVYIDHFSISLGVLEGSLCLLEVNGADVTIWVMQNYGVRESWTKRFTEKKRFLNNDEIGYFFPRLLWSFKSGQILLGVGYTSSLVVYDFENKTLVRPKTSGFRKSNDHYEDFYFESLVSLNSGTYVRKEQNEEPNEKKNIKKPKKRARV